MSDVLHEHAKMLARNLLRLQICTIGEIAETLELEPHEVQQLAIEVYDERAEHLTALRQIMNDIKEGHSGRQQQEALLFDAIGILNQCLHRREPGRGETADIRNWIRNLADHDLTLYLDKLYMLRRNLYVTIYVAFGRLFSALFRPIIPHSSDFSCLL